MNYSNLFAFQIVFTQTSSLEVANSSEIYTKQQTELV